MIQTSLAQRLIRRSKTRERDLQEAVKNQDLNQPGLMEALVGSLADGWAPLANFVSQKVLPSYGEAAVPLLSRAIKSQGGLADARTLRLINLRAARRVARRCIHTSHKSLAYEAIRCLSGSEGDAHILLQQAHRRKRDHLRRAAYRSLRGVSDKAVIDAVIKAFKAGVGHSAEAMAFSNEREYTDLCLASLKELGDPSSLSPMPEEMVERLRLILSACRAHGGNALDEVLLPWTTHVGGQLNMGVVGEFFAEEELLEVVAIGTLPQSQRRLVERRGEFPTKRLTRVMGAGSWHHDLSLFDLFSQVLRGEAEKDRCRGWSCWGDPWSCSVLSAIEFVLEVDFDAPGYDGDRPKPLQRRLVERVRQDRERWDAARKEAIST